MFGLAIITLQRIFMAKGPKTRQANKGKKTSAQARKEKYAKFSKAASKALLREVQANRPVEPPKRSSLDFDWRW